MKKWIALGLFAFVINFAQAQNGHGLYRVRPYYSPQPNYNNQPYNSRRLQQKRNKPIDNFKPTLSISAGIGFPNLDQNQLLDFTNAYHGSNSVSGPWIGSIDYRFNRSMSIGILATTGTVSRNYFDASSNQQAFSGNVKNTAIMLDFIRYMPGSRSFSPYLRTAIGVNIWNSNYNYPDGTSVTQPINNQPLAYQASLGVKINTSHASSLFLEAGYGKYIFAGGINIRL